MPYFKFEEISKTFTEVLATLKHQPTSNEALNAHTAAINAQFDKVLDQIAKIQVVQVPVPTVSKGTGGGEEDMHIDAQGDNILKPQDEEDKGSENRSKETQDVWETLISTPKQPKVSGWVPWPDVV